MNADTLKGNWKQLVGSAKEKWGEITENEWLESEGNFEKIVGKIQERYGRGRDEVVEEVNEWLKSRR